MRYRSENIDKDGKLYGRFMMMPGVWALTSRWANIMYLLIGSDKALLIDTGYGEGSFREVVEEITDKPVMVVNTHGHYDHTGGNGWWPEAWMTEPAVAIARQTFAPVHDEWAARMPYPDYQINLIKDGDVIELGERQVEIIEIPAHNESSIALLDRKSGILFCGDELEGGQVLLFVRNEAVSREEVLAKHKQNMLKLKSRRADYDFICPAHNGTMLWPDRYLDDYIRLAEGIINKTITPQPDSAGFGFGPVPGAYEGPFKKYAPFERYEYGEASFIFQKG